MSKDINIHITIKNADNFAFTIMVVGIVLLWFTAVAFAPEQERLYESEIQEYLDYKSSQPVVSSSGMEW